MQTIARLRKMALTMKPLSHYAFPCLNSASTIVLIWFTNEHHESVQYSSKVIWKLQWRVSTPIQLNSQPAKTRILLISPLLFSALPLQLEKQFARYHLAQLSSLFCLHSAVSSLQLGRCLMIDSKLRQMSDDTVGLHQPAVNSIPPSRWVFRPSSHNLLIVIIQMVEIPEPVRHDMTMVHVWLEYLNSRYRWERDAAGNETSAQLTNWIQA